MTSSPTPTPAVTRRIKFPLSLKVATWLLLNVLFLVGVAALILFARTGFSWDSLFSRAAANRVEAVANVIVTELLRDPSRNRNEVLAPFSAAYGADFYLFGPEGTQLGGSAVTLPASVHARVRELTAGFDGGPGGMRGGRPPSPPMAPALGQPTPEGQREAPSLSELRTSADIDRLVIAGQRDERSRFVELIRGSPSVYWIGVRVLVPSEGGFRRRAPAVLIAKTDPLGGAGLIFDLRPLLIGTAVVVGLSVLFWLPVVRGVTRSLRRLTGTAEAIADGRLDARVVVDRRDEIGRLGETVNTMAARLESNATGQKRFIGDIAHELGSPLARMQFATSILEERAGKDLAPAVADVREEVQHMSELVSELLAFTRAGLRPREVKLTDVSMAPLVTKVLDREDAAGKVAVRLAPDLRVLADEPLLSRALGNLVRNAVRYAGDAGEIQLEATAATGDKVILTVSDRGPGVPPEALARLGEPFYRPESARTRETGGVGLGLAIVRSAVEACGGTLRFSNRVPNGFQAEITLRSATSR
jgi:two-component system, OmpR family, sensor histidine kinase CpxA